jgi:dTDP-4-amino-4,6-dideoxygalactose transaminase
VIPYGKHTIRAADRAAVLRALDSGWLTGGVEVSAFEAELRTTCAASSVVSCSNGTTALHLVADALEAPRGAWWIVPPCTFVASAQAALYAGYRPVFADCDPETGLIDPNSVAELLEAAIDHAAPVAAVVAVDLNGHPAPKDDLLDLLDTHHVPLVRDAAHSLGAVDCDGQPVGADSGVLATTLSFHPVKLIAAGEGGAIATADEEFAATMRHRRSHAMTRSTDRQADYRVDAVGFNYRLSDLHAALGRSQLARIDEKLAHRRALADHYAAHFADAEGVDFVRPLEGSVSAWHLASIRVPAARRWDLIRVLREQGIGAAHHYPAAHLQPVYEGLLPGLAGTCPGAERYCSQQVTLPLHDDLGTTDVDRIAEAVLAWR